MTMAVYIIRHAPTNRVYVGASSNAESRWIRYRSRLRAGTGPIKLQRAWDKSSEKHFTFRIVHKCMSIAKLNLFEMQFIEKYNAVRKGFNCNAFSWVPNAKVKKKISRKNTGKKLTKECKAKMSAARRGKKLSKEHRQAISRGRKGMAFSAEHVENIRLARLAYLKRQRRRT